MTGRTTRPCHQCLPLAASQPLLKTICGARPLRRTAGERRRILHPGQLLHEEIAIPRGARRILIGRLLGQQLLLGRITAGGRLLAGTERLIPAHHPLAEQAQAKAVDGDMVHGDKPGPPPLAKAIEGGGKQRPPGQIEGDGQLRTHLGPCGRKRVSFAAQIPLCQLPASGVGHHLRAIGSGHKSAVQTGDLVDGLAHRTGEVMGSQRPLQQPVLAGIAGGALRIFLLGKPDASLSCG